MEMSKARKRELLQIALHEVCDIDIKYAAARELQRRGKTHCPDTVRQYDGREEKIISQLYSQGYLLSDIALRFGRSKQGIKDKLRELHKRGLPYRTFSRWSKTGIVPGRGTGQT
ncbi:hypothetical protein CHH67_19130 [Paenibacillus campinasensis]|uniref:Uncharacterized protein n=1 Tax=Paenibacillus campinasensis TaxID=66347 RepID=A0A268ELE3_9BACL|nr:hypothetical protein CHH67_19130 [Paenibacillus campinasensis]